MRVANEYGSCMTGASNMTGASPVTTILTATA